jgi:hypothetical protein
MSYRFIEDPGHGWLEVPKAELVELGIAGQISPYSYHWGEMAYLEEDGDLAVFMKAKGLHKPGGFKELGIVEVYQENTFVRNCPSYRSAA